jgi:hypothetical protein
VHLLQAPRESPAPGPAPLWHAGDGRRSCFVPCTATRVAFHHGRRDRRLDAWVGVALRRRVRITRCGAVAGEGSWWAASGGSKAAVEVRERGAEKAKAGATGSEDDGEGTTTSLAIYLSRKERPASGIFKRLIAMTGWDKGDLGWQSQSFVWRLFLGKVPTRRPRDGERPPPPAVAVSLVTATRHLWLSR